MKPLLFFFMLILFFGTKIQAQSPSFGAYLGLNSSNMRFTDDGISLKGSSLAGLRVSGIIEMPMTENISVMGLPGISVKGTKFLGEKISLTYLDIPLYGVYRYQIGPGQAIGGAGIYLGFALAGKAGGEKMNFADDGIKRIDAGANFLLGYELPDLGVRFQLTLSPGIASIGDDDVKVKNSTFGIGIGYVFKRP